jgi:hypothetical protein
MSTTAPRSPLRARDRNAVQNLAASAGQTPQRTKDVLLRHLLDGHQRQRGRRSVAPVRQEHFGIHQQARGVDVRRGHPLREQFGRQQAAIWERVDPQGVVTHVLRIVSAGSRSFLCERRANYRVGRSRSASDLSQVGPRQTAGLDRLT